MADITTLDPRRAEGMRWLRGRLQWEATLTGLRQPFGTDRLTAGDSGGTLRAA